MKKDSFTNKIFFILLICLISLVSSDLLSISKSIALNEKVKALDNEINDLKIENENTQKRNRTWKFVSFHCKRKS